MVVFAFLPYSPGLNKIKNSFGRLKSNISFQNLNSKYLKSIIIEEKKKIIISLNTSENI